MTCISIVTPLPKLPYTSLQTFNHKAKTPIAYSAISFEPSLLSPYTRSTKLIGTSATVQPIAFALTIISIWKVYPLLSVLRITFSSTFFLYSLKLPVKSLTPGLSTVSANKFAPLETSFLFKSQPYTPPFPAYLVPVTISYPPFVESVFCFAIISEMNFGWCEKSASMMMTKFPVANCMPWTYAVPRPSLPARACRWTCGAYTLASCLATTWVPSGLPSSTIMSSQSRSLQDVSSRQQRRAA